MHRRDISTLLLATTAASAATVPVQHDGGQSCLRPCEPQTTAETAAGVKPADTTFPPGDVRRYGVTGDGKTDDTAAIQRAFKVGAAGQLITFPSNLICKTTSQLTYYAGPGIIMDTASSYIAPHGTGFIALVIRPAESGSLYGQFSLRVEGAGQTLNGVYILNAKDHIYQHLVVNGFDGFGVVLDKNWDSTYLNISIQSCGNNRTTNVSAINPADRVIRNYAFSMLDGGGTCNELHIARLQVELGTAQVIWIAPNTLSCVIDKIHSEQAMPVRDTTTWQIGGNRCQYNTVRLHSDSPSAHATARITGSRWIVSNLLAEDAIVVEANATGGTGTLLEPEIAGPFGMQPGQTGRIRVFGGGIAHYGTVPDGYVRFYDTLGPDGYNSGGINDVAYHSKHVRNVTARYDFVLEDSRLVVQYAAAAPATMTIPANAAVAYPLGTVLELINVGGSAVTLAITADTLTWSPSGDTGSRTVNVNGVARIRKISATGWLLEGTGIA